MKGPVPRRDEAVECETRGQATAVFYHYVRDSAKTAFPEIKALGVADFVAQLESLRARGPIGDYPALEAALDGGPALAAGSALLTFDDGLVDHHTTVFPALRARGLTGIFFVTGTNLASSPRLLTVHKTHFLLARLGIETFAAEVRRLLESFAGNSAGALHSLLGVYRYDHNAESATKHLLNYELPFDVADRMLDGLFRRHIGDPAEFAASLYLSPSMIREMVAGGMAFGFHTENHPVLSRLSPAEQRAEVALGVERIRALTGQQSVPFCYPYGHAHTYNTATLAVLRDSGYSMAFTTVRRPVRIGADNRYELPRVDTRDLQVSAASHA